MRVALQIVAWLALAGILISPFLLFAGLTIGVMKTILLGSTVVWFVVTPLWVGMKKV